MDSYTVILIRRNDDAKPGERVLRKRTEKHINEKEYNDILNIIGD